MRFTYAKKVYSLFVFQHLLYGFLHHVGRHHGLEAEDGLAVFGDQELAEVPADGIALVEARASLLVNLVKLCGKLLGAFGIALEGCLFLEVGVERALRLTVEQIAAQMNYDNVSYLCRFFRNATGQSMMEFRRKQR